MQATCVVGAAVARPPAAAAAVALRRALQRTLVVGKRRRGAFSTAPCLIRAAAGPQQQPEEQHGSGAARTLQRVAATGAAALLVSAAVLLVAPGGQLAALAADSKKVGTCLLQNCQAALANCLVDGLCVENLVCLQLCNDSPDETACQIKCGDKYADKAIEAFNSCAVTEKKCVPQRVDVDAFPVPPDCALDNSFDLASFQGRWYITAGLNPLFDTFDCQEHFFASPEPGLVYAKINWRIPLVDALDEEEDFIDRSTMQRFVQDKTTPAVLLNHDNEFLNYQDDWYIIASKPDEYVFVYYRGQNDAWVGYGGATVYTRNNTLPEEYIPELKAAAEAAGIDWSKMQITDNSCPPHPPERTVVQRLKGRAEKTVQQVEYEIEDDLRSFGRGFTVLEQDVSQELQAKEKALEKQVMYLEEEAKKAGQMIRRFEMEAKMGPWINWIPLSVRQIIMPVA